MKSIDEAASIATRYALDDSHGYAQDKRNGPDYDCSSLMGQVLREAGFDVHFTWTGNMEQDLLANGFKKLSVNLATSAELKRGDILLYHNSISGNGHTAMYVGDGKIVHASSNEFGGISGGQEGDQTGKEICVTNYFNFPWSGVFRYAGEQDKEVNVTYYTVKPFDTLWSIARLFNTTIDKLCELNKIQNKNLIYCGQVLKVTEDANTVVEDKKDFITITIEGATIITCKHDDHTITIEVGN